MWPIRMRSGIGIRRSIRRRTRGRAAITRRSGSRTIPCAPHWANSIVWYYRELATKVGERRMKEWLAEFGMATRTFRVGLIISGWNSMKISPNQQVEFLTKLQSGHIAVAKKNLDTVKEILTQDSAPEYKLIGKTGSSGTGEGWLVGWVERADGGGCSFALHMKAASFDEMRKARPGLAKEMLRKAGCMGVGK